VGGSSRSPHRFYLVAKLARAPVRLAGTQASSSALVSCGDATVRLCGERVDEITKVSNRLRWWKGS